MLASITPLGERGRRRRWGITTTAYVVGSVSGGAAAGLLAGSAGWLLLRGVAAATRAEIVVALLAAGLALDALGRVPGPRRQVDESWLDRYRGGVYGFGFGVQLGAGVVTLVSASAVYAVLGAAAASASLAAGTAIGAVAGLLRGMTLLTTWRVRDPQRLVGFHARMQAWRRPVSAGALVAQAALVAAALGALAA